MKESVISEDDGLNDNLHQCIDNNNGWRIRWLPPVYKKSQMNKSESLKKEAPITNSLDTIKSEDLWNEREKTPPNCGHSRTPQRMQEHDKGRRQLWMQRETTLLHGNKDNNWTEKVDDDFDPGNQWWYVWFKIRNSMIMWRLDGNCWTGGENHLSTNDTITWILTQ